MSTAAARPRRDVRIIDAQIHEPEPALRAWDAESAPEPAGIVSCELALAAMDAVGVDFAVLSARADWTELAVTRHPDRFAALAVIDPDASDLEEQVERAGATPGVCGVRVVITWPETAGKVEKLRAGGYAALLRALERHRVPTCFNLSGALTEAHAVATSYPELTIVIDNLGLVQPPIRVPDSPPWRRVPELVSLAQYPNVFVKLIGAPTLSAASYPFPDVWPQLTQVLEAFGPERLMWGSDFTRCKPLTTYAESLGYLLYAEGLSPSDKRHLFEATATRVLRLPEPPARPAEAQ